MSIAVRIAEFWNLLKARVAYVAGRRDRARGALKSAIRRNPGSFVAHFMLGRLYWRDRVPVKSKREFDLAWQIDPERFERAYARLQESPDGAPELFTYSAGTHRHEVPVSMSLRDESATDDFVSDDERRRFATLPPITPDEIHSIDWDRLEEEIGRDDY